MSKEFGDKLRAIRKDKRWSLAKMAEFLGTNKQTLSRYERNERDPKISDAAAFSEKLGIPLPHSVYPNSAISVYVIELHKKRA